MTPWMQPIRDPSAWTNQDLQDDRSWEFILDERQKSELVSALHAVKKSGLTLAEITKENFALPSLHDELEHLLNELRRGRGFALLRGVPTEE